MELIPFPSNIHTADTHFAVDDDDYEKISQFGWRVGGDNKDRKTPQFRVERSARKSEKDAGSPGTILLHRFIMGVGLKYAIPNEEVDHINRNAFDCRKSTLRICTKHTNQRNKGNNSKMGYGLWGATFNKAIKNPLKQWQANFHMKKKTYMVGNFASETEAHEAALRRYKEIT